MTIDDLAWLREHMEMKDLFRVKSAILHLLQHLDAPLEDLSKAVTRLNDEIASARKV